MKTLKETRMSIHKPTSKPLAPNLKPERQNPNPEQTRTNNPNPTLCPQFQALQSRDYALLELPVAPDTRQRAAERASGCPYRLNP